MGGIVDRLRTMMMVMMMMMMMMMCVTSKVGSTAVQTKMLSEHIGKIQPSAHRYRPRS